MRGDISHDAVAAMCRVAFRAIGVEAHTLTMAERRRLDSAIYYFASEWSGRDVDFLQLENVLLDFVAVERWAGDDGEKVTNGR